MSKAGWLFYVAAKPRYGGGHVMRSLQLAQAMHQLGEDVSFFLGGGAADRLRGRIFEDGFDVLPETSEDFDCKGMWVDHYEPDINILKRFHGPVCGIIDEEKPHDFDYALSYAPNTFSTLSGFEYCLIDPSFSQIKRTQPTLKNIAISFGQADGKNITPMILTALNEVEGSLNISVVCGALNTHKEQVAAACKTSPHNVVLYDAPDGLHDIFSQADILITAGGVTVLEACAAGLACVVVATADNQHAQIKTLAGQGAILFAGDYREISIPSLVESLKALEPERFEALGRAAKNLIDGNGAQRLAEILLEWSKTGR